MKRILLPILSVCLMCAVSCIDYTEQIEKLQKEIDELSATLEDLGKVADNLGALRNVLVIEQAGDPIESVTKTGEGYTFKFKNNGEVTVAPGTMGISVEEADGEYYWTLDGKPLKDASGNNAKIAVTPRFRVQEGEAQVSTDGGKNWTPVVKNAKPVISKVEEDAAYITVSFLGGKTIQFAKEPVMSVSLSGDGSTMASEGRAVVDFLISGDTGNYSVVPVVGEGWSTETEWENNAKGRVVFTAPAGDASQARLIFCDGFGRAVTADIDFASLTVDENFPVMYPVREAYNVLAAGGSVAVILRNNRDEYTVEIDPEGTWLTKANSKAIRDDAISFVAEPNESAEMRCTEVTFTAGDYVKKVLIWQDGFREAAGEELSANGTANCYIVSKAGDYWFDASVMGCGESGIIPNVDFHSESAELQPEGCAVLLNENDVVSDVRFENDKVYFHASGAEGNALISVQNGRGYNIWSWHIWCTDVPNDRTHTNPDNLRFTVLDRNLGATSADAADGVATHGLYYQWGRKDPFQPALVIGNMFANTAHAFLFAIRYPQRPFTMVGNSLGNWYGYPNIYLWGNPDYSKNHPVKELTKTIYDPCPVGYMVPPANTFLIFKDDAKVEYSDAGITILGDFGQTNFFPWAGKVYDGSSSIGSEVDLWHSSNARYDSGESTGGTHTRVEIKVDEETQQKYYMQYFYDADIRARCMPVRCVKQVTE